MLDDVRTQQLPFRRSRGLPPATLGFIIIVAAASFGLGLNVGSRKSTDSATGNASGAPGGVDFSPVWKAWSVIDEKFVPAAVASSTPVATSTEDKDQQRVWGMIQGLAESLNDPYTFFLPPTENKVFEQDMSGAFEGVGMEIAVRNEVLTVVSPLKGSPAEKAGIKSGDLVLKIDGTVTKGLDINDAVNKIRGPKGSVVVITIMRQGWDAPKDIRVARDTISVPTIQTTSMPGGIFRIQLLTFTSNSPDLFRDALRRFVETGDTKLILDLRGNPGGYLDAAVDMASWFLPAGDVVVTEDYDGHATNIIHRSRGYDVFNKNLKMVVLADHGSASASEILADALRYWHVAKLVGVNTFGKGSVQELVNITPDSSLKVTVARWLGPDNVQIPLEGITPDVKVDLTDADATAGKDPQLDKAVHVLNSM